MGLFEDLLGGFLKCLCGSQTDQRPPELPPKQEVTQQQPAPIYPPTQPGRPSQQQPQPVRPTYAEQVSHQVPQTTPPAEEPAPDHHKKHKKHHGHGQSQDHSINSGDVVQGQTHGHTAITPQPASPPHNPSSPPRPWSPGSGRPDPNQVNQHNEFYMGLRARASAAGDEMARNFDAAHKAYESGDGAQAKELSNAGRAAQKEMERLNEEAAEWIFRENNTDSQPGEVDLHGLYVKEAIRFTEKSIAEARARGDSQIRLIVGKGLHSTNHAAKLKPAIEELMQKDGLVAELDEHNSGVLIVSLTGQATGKGRVVGPEELTRGLEKKDECIIM